MIGPTRAVRTPFCQCNAVPSFGQKRSVSGYSTLQVGQIFNALTVLLCEWDGARPKDARAARTVTVRLELTSIARIWLVRHGPSSHVHDGRWMHHTIVPGFEDAYDSMGIIPDCVPPAHLLRVAATVDAICSSDLPRATESAQRLALGREVLISPLLREVRLEPPRWIPLALPIEA